MGATLRDLRFGIQTLLRAPGFTVVAVATLALGIGANSAIFSVVSGTLLYSLPWEEPATIVSLSERNRRTPEDLRGVSSAKYLDWREQARSFADLGAVLFWGMNLTDGERLDFVDGARVTPNCYRMLGLRPLLGRGLVEADAAPGAEPAVVLGEGLWKRRYGADPGVVGRRIEIDGEPATVVGVQSEGQWFPWPWTQVVAPLRLEPDELSRTDHLLGGFGRLAPGVTLQQARTEMELISARLGAQYPESDRDWTVDLALTRDLVVQGRQRSGVWVMMGAVTLVLLIACANVANLLLARAAGRQKEMAIRAALGATRGQIARQLLTEAVVLAAVALPFAVLVTRWAISFFLSQVPPSVPYMAVFFRFDPPVWIFCAAVTLLTVLFFGLAPALQASRPDLASGLKEGGDRGTSHAGRQRLRFSLVVGEIGLALALLVSAGLLIQSFLKLQSADPGFSTENLVVTAFSLPEARYPEPDHQRAFHREVLARLERLPELRGVATTNHAPFGFGGAGVDFRVRGRPLASDDEIPNATFANISPNYLELLGVPLLRGRWLERYDRASTRWVVLINETLAKRYFPGRDPVGEHLVFALGAGAEEREREVVGVVADMVNWTFTEEAWPRIYAPFAQEPWSYISVVARTRGSPLSAVPAIRAEFASLDPELPLFQFETMRSRLERSKWQARLFFVVMAGLGGLALVLAAIGVYGVVSYSTAQRTREFGIRAALGAAPAWIAGLVLREAIVLAGLGLSLGALLSAGMARVLQNLLYEVSPWSPLTFIAVSLLLAAVALLATAVPARRATRVDPMIALRVE